MKHWIFGLLALASCLDVPETDSVTSAATIPPACRPAWVQSHGNTIATGGEFWPGNTVHQVPAGVTVNAPLLIGPCSIVQVGPGQSIIVGANGSIANQTNMFGNGVRFTALTTTWAQLVLSGGSASFTNATFDHGGLETTSQLPMTRGQILIDNASSKLSATNLAINGSASYGLNLAAGSFGAVSGLSIFSSARAPVFIGADRVDLLPAGGYAGNATDAIVIPASGDHVVTHNEHWQDLGVPYQIGNDDDPVLSMGTLDIDSGTSTPAMLVLDPGVTLRFAKGNAMRVSTAGVPSAAARGILFAVGSAAQPIVFMSASATPHAGDWDGIIFNDIVDHSTAMLFTHVLHAGGNTQFKSQDACSSPTTSSSTAAAIRIQGPEPTREFVQLTTVALSANMGIDRGFQSDTPTATGHDFAPNNQFSQIAGCDETLPRRARDNGCASTCTQHVGP